LFIKIPDYPKLIFLTFSGTEWKKKPTVFKSIGMRWAEHAAHMGERRIVYRVLAGRPEGKRSLGRPRRR
jgi:hypothetical protein